MKKALCIPFLLLLAIPSFANENIYIEGTAVEASHRMYFMDNFAMEASSLGYNVVSNRQDAAYTFRFEVSYNDDQYGDEPAPQFILKIALINNANNAEMLSFTFPYSTLDEMYEYNQFLFVRAVTSIPPDEDGAVNRSWQNRILYIRASFDYPIVFYALQSDGLHAGVAAYNDNRTNFDSLDNKVIARPGATIGLEVQIIKFLAVEANIQGYWGAPGNDQFFNLGVNAQIKVPIMFPGVVLQPYGAFSCPFFVSDVFTQYYPPFSLGGGIQAGVKAGKRGSIFIDVNYLVNVKKVATRNPFGDFAPNPPNIFYRRSVIGLSAGYKIGFFERKR